MTEVFLHEDIRAVEIVIDTLDPVAHITPRVLVQPVIFPTTVEVDDAVTCTTGTWNYYPYSFAYQWMRDDVDIVGATSSSYTAVEDDDETILTCKVMATNADGNSVYVVSSNYCVVANTLPRILLSNAVVSESAVPGTVIGELQVINVSGTPTFSIFSDPSGKFEITGTSLRTTALLDYELATLHTITVVVSGVIPEADPTDFMVIVTDIPDSPAIVISNNLIAENSSVGTVVGTLSTVFTAGTPIFTLSGTAGGKFSLSGNQILVAGSLDYELAQSHTLTVSSSGTTPGITPNQPLTVYVTNVVETATIGISNTMIPDDLPAGGFVATLSVTNVIGSPVYSFIGGDHGGRFAISGSTVIRGATSLDFGTNKFHNLAIAVTGTVPIPTATTFTVYVLDHDYAFTDGTVVGDYFVDGSALVGPPDRNFFINSIVRTQRNIALREVHTTGSIPAASNQLTVASVAGFLVGDPIIIETGGEVPRAGNIGLGQHGSIGVGGQWPALMYANKTAMDADTSQVTGKWAGLHDTKETWRWNEAGTLVWYAQPELRYYTNTVSPKAHTTTISAIDAVGKILTLAVPSVEASTNANVYFDNKTIISTAIAVPGAWIEWVLPAGTFATSEQIKFIMGTGAQGTGYALRGAGRDLTTLKIPHGVWSSTNTGWISFYQCSDVVVSDLHLHDNFGLHGFGLWYADAASFQGAGYLYGVSFGIGDNCVARNVLTTNIHQSTVSVSYGTNCWAYNCKGIRHDPLMHYIQWEFIWADTIGGGMVDCELDCDWFTGGPAVFKSNGFYNLRFRGRNASMECNSSGGWIYDNPVLNFEEDKRHQWTLPSGGPTASFSQFNPLINVNSNIATSSGITGTYVDRGGSIIDAEITQGYADVQGNTHIGIVVNTYNPNITITRGFSVAPDFANPPPIPPSPHRTNGAIGINSTGPSTFVSNFTSRGTTVEGWYNINVSHGTATDCEFNTMKLEGVTYVG